MVKHHRRKLETKQRQARTGESYQAALEAIRNKPAFPGVPDHPTNLGQMSKLPLDFEAFHRMHRAAFVTWATTYLNHTADAEEAVDSAFEQVLMVWPEVLGKESPAAYAWQVLKYRTIDMARARGRREVPADTAAFDSIALHEPADPIGQLEESIDLFQVIRALPAKQQDVIVLLAGGYSTREIADHLGLAPAVVHTLARAARRTLRLTDAYPVLDERGHREEAGV
ncbi:RNA polymerase sigma factor [Streptomyces lanatus]|uniref:Sigma-70 family RNA polymerase sigma factor n=1 Tax=Streptomyces lanatus TaxID=66900 RepID=A0ABV1XR63_9ACTN|nr:sigma-70 family RNA polymerase sigma factor [Streptomyces lanatus]GHH06085.1 hypothetical protein GCM10018780_38510 [Streptomyces lanatus]